MELYINITLLTPIVFPLRVWVIKFTISPPYTTDTKFSKDWPNSSLEGNVNVRRTTDDAQRTIERIILL